MYVVLAPIVVAASILTSDYIDEKLQRFLVQSQANPGCFFILLKLHKASNPGRPIVFSNGHPTEHISEFVDFFLKPLVTKLASHIKGTTDFLNKLRNLPNLLGNTLLVTPDVSSLYTNIPHNDGINICLFFFLHGTRNSRDIPTEPLTL